MSPAKRNPIILFYRLLLLVLSIGYFTACQTLPDRVYKTSELDEGEWSAKAMVRDKKKKSNNYLRMDLSAIRTSHLRMDVTATSLGIHLATFVMNKGKTRYLLAREKKFYKGPTGPEMMNALVKVPLNPRVFNAFLFDIPPDESEWECMFDGQKYLKTCNNLSRPLEIVWLKREGNKRVIKVSSERADITLNLQLVRPKVQNKKVSFRLNPPKGYKVYRLK